MLDSKLQPLYSKYNMVLKPLIAEYESRNENFVTSLLHDLPDMFDYVAIYSETNDDANIDKAMKCLNDAIDSMRICLVGSLMQDIGAFKERVPEKMRMTLDGGRFFGHFTKLEDEVRHTKDTDLEKTYSLLKEMEGMVNDVHSSSIANGLLIEGKNTIIAKWAVTITIALLVNFIIFMLV